MTKDEQRAMANRIKARRKALKYTQEQFAELLEISTSSYTRIENVFQRPALDTLIKISKNLKISLDYIVFGENDAAEGKTTDMEMLTALLDFSDKDKMKHVVEVLDKLSKIKGGQ
ncbi:MAG: helix-turn-helix domain-containing protein [Defluviitaleaceae bacterium]|nr:helix-turn-helix domain-containing protein [Defluviitaleaceae bacterium]